MCEQDRLISSKKATDADVGDHFKREDCQGITVIFQKNAKKMQKKNTRTPYHNMHVLTLSSKPQCKNKELSLGKVLVRHKLHCANPISKDTIKPRLYFTTQILDTK